MFKDAVERRKPQLWSEVIAYRLGVLLGVTVPPAFVAVDGQRQVAGVLVEFFYGFPGDNAPPRFVHGVDLMQGMHVNLMRGSLRDNLAVCRAHKVAGADRWWGRTIAFDALIGNTDRHLENWGLLVRREQEGKPEYSLPPVYDNGTSLGWEMAGAQMEQLQDPDRLARYIARGTHHYGWDPGDRPSAQHAELCKVFCGTYRSTLPEILGLLGFQERSVAEICQACTHFDVEAPFTKERALFVTNLLMARQRALIAALGG